GRVRAHVLHVRHAELVVLGAGARLGVVSPVAFGVRVRRAEHGGCGPGAQGQRGELVVEVRTGGGLRVQAVHGAALDLLDVLGAHDEGVPDLPGVDHARGHRHRIDEAEAGVGDVEVHRAAGQAQGVVDARGHGRLQVLTGDGGVDQQTDLVAHDPGLGHGPLGGQHDSLLPSVLAVTPPAALVHARHAL